MADPIPVYYSWMGTPLGKLLLAATYRGLRYVRLDGSLPPKKKTEVWIEFAGALRPYEEQLQAYFRGDLREFTCQLDLVGTEFQKKCWRALMEIPYGKTCSYAEQALRVGSPKAFRAVGQANHRNPIPIIVPCHRVIASTGTLGGYGGGLSAKERLLAIEGLSGFSRDH